MRILAITANHNDHKQVYIWVLLYDTKHLAVWCIVS